MHVIFAVNCWVSMKLLNRTQPTNLQLCSNQSINQPKFLVWAERVPKNTFALSPCTYAFLLSSFDESVFRIILFIIGKDGVDREH